MTKKIFINRRTDNDRRKASDPCRDLAVDLYNRKRRKSVERREERSLKDDYYAFVEDKDKITISHTQPAPNSDLH